MKRIYRFLLLFLMISFKAWPVVLEDLPRGKLFRLLSGKTVGFYIGSFDPLHKGHEQIVSNALTQKLVDYVLIYPA